VAKAKKLCRLTLKKIVKSKEQEQNKKSILSAYDHSKMFCYTGSVFKWDIAFAKNVKICVYYL
jgi:hypothetical protein